MEQRTIWQDKRLWYAGIITIIVGCMVFLSQNVTEILSVGITQGLNQLATVLTVENLANSGDVIIWTMVSALGWRLGGAFVFAIILCVAGIISYRRYRRYVQTQAQSMHWYDWCLVLTGVISSAIPLLIFGLTVIFGLFYLFNTFQAWNQLTITTFEPMITVIQEFFAILNGFTLSVENVKELVAFLPGAVEAFSNAGNIAILWTQTLDIIQQIRSLNLIFEWSKVLAIASILISDVALVVYLLKPQLEISEEIIISEVPTPTPPSTPDEIDK